jgi:hypothetical protein
MTTEQLFIQRVAKMRELQKEYFRTRSMTSLQKAKQMEVIVDRDLKSFSDLAPQSPTEQEIAF